MTKAQAWDRLTGEIRKLEDEETGSEYFVRRVQALVAGLQLRIEYEADNEEDDRK